MSYSVSGFSEYAFALDLQPCGLTELRHALDELGAITSDSRTAISVDSKFLHRWIVLPMCLPPGEQTIHDEVAGFGGLSKVGPQLATEHIENAKGH